MAQGRWVLHVDLDEFIAAVEVLRRPELRDRPVVVGGTGDPTRRGVVATASYRAREFGVQSGLPLRSALKRCPDAVFLPSDPDAYNDVSERVMTTVRAFDLPVEVLGWDEAFLAFDGADPEALAADVQRSVREHTRLECSVGVGDNRLRAKLATVYAKPGGIFRLTAHNWYAVMADSPTDALWGIGTKTARRLAELGMTTVGELAADPDGLAARLGPTMGPWYRHLARGHASREVVTRGRVARSRSRETTFQRDLTTWSEIRQEITTLAERVADDVVAEGRPAARVAVKVRFAPFETRTHEATLDVPTQHGADIEQAALRVLERFDHERPVRLLGVRAEFAPEQPDGQAVD